MSDVNQWLAKDVRWKRLPKKDRPRISFHVVYARVRCNLGRGRRQKILARVVSKRLTPKTAPMPIIDFSKSMLYETAFVSLASDFALSIAITAP